MKKIQKMEQSGWAAIGTLESRTSTPTEIFTHHHMTECKKFKVCRDKDTVRLTCRYPLTRILLSGPYSANQSHRFF
jgi:hypothetical protein